MREPADPEHRGRTLVGWTAIIVAQIAFMEWTPDGRLRHPSFLGLRFDKPAREVVRTPAEASEASDHYPLLVEVG